MIDRRTFVATMASSALALPTLSSCTADPKDNGPPEGAPTDAAMKFGLCTYLWGKDWELPELIANCTKANTLGVELRSTHAHGVELHLDAAARRDVKKRFADSPVTLVGLGSDERFDNPDPAQLASAVQATKDFLVLSHDVGGTGVKVKPDSFHPGVDHDVTIRQIGETLATLGPFAHDLGQEIRVEVHGQCQELPTMKRIMDFANQPGVALCWNCNPQDLHGDGLDANFALVRDRFGGTVHVRELQDENYPYQQLIDRLVASDYGGWVLMEARSKQDDLTAALADQSQRFDAMVASAASRRG